MVHLIVQLSKYIMIILFLIYTFLCFHLFKYPDKPKKQRHIYNLQRFYMFLIHLDGFLVLFVTTMDTKIIGFYIAQLVLFESIYLIYHKFYKNASELVLNNMVMMLCISMIILTRISFDKALRQFVFCTCRNDICVFNTAYHAKRHVVSKTDMDICRCGNTWSFVSSCGRSGEQRSKAFFDIWSCFNSAI